MTIHLPENIEADLIKAAEHEGKTPEQLAAETLISWMNHREMPRNGISSDGHHRTLPTERTFREIFESLPQPEWSEEETDEKLQVALKRMG